MWVAKNAQSLMIISNNNHFVCDLIAILDWTIPFTHYSTNESLYFRYQVFENYIVIEDDPGIIGAVINQFYSYSYKRQVNILICLNESSIGEEKEHAYLEIFNKTISLSMRNVYLIVYNAEDVLFVRYDIHYSLIKTYGIHSELEFRRDLYKFDYNGHEIVATIFESVPTAISSPSDDGSYTGTDITILSEIARQLNATFKHHEPRDGITFGARLPNGEGTGAIGELYRHESDIAGNQLFIKQYDTPELEFSHVFTQDALCVMVPKAGKVPAWTSLFSTYTFSVWALAFTVFLVSAVLLRTIRLLKLLISDEKSGHSFDASISTCLLDCMQMFFSCIPAQYFCRKYYERLFIGMVLLYVLVFNTTFTCSLVKILTSTRYYPDINTLEDLDASGLKISTMSASLADTFHASDRDYMHRLNKKLVLLPYTAAPYNAYLARATKTQYMDIIDLKTTGTVTTHMVKECPQHYVLAYLAHRNSMIFNDVNTVLLYLFEAGLPNMWHEELMANTSLEHSYTSNQAIAQVAAEHGDEPRVINMSDMQTCFYLLLVGLFCGGTLFLLEINLMLGNKIHQKDKPSMKSIDNHITF